MNGFLKTFRSPSSLQRQSMICELLFPSSILAVKLNRKTLVIVLENEIYIYDISNMRLLHVIETTPNPEGQCLRRTIQCQSEVKLSFLSDCRSITLIRQLISGLSFACPIAYFCSVDHITTRSIRVTVGRRSHFLYSHSVRCKCYPSSQVTYLLFVYQLNWYSSGYCI